MGDFSSDTSMEDILSSIKRIIAEEGEGAITRADRRPRSVPGGTDGQRDVAAEPIELASGDAVLELREAVAEAVEHPQRSPRGQSDRDEDARREAAPVKETDPKPDRKAKEASEENETILSKQAAAASRGQLESLSRLIVRPETAGSDTLEGLVREMLRPMLREWLDANLPNMVERMVQREIARITRES